MFLIFGRWIALLLLIAGCATPVAPTGGVPVRTSPEILQTSPQAGQTFVTGNEVSFTFNRFMNRGTAARAVRVEPDQGIPFQVSWKRKTMTVKFSRPFPDSVTVIVSLAQELADVNGNRLGRPYQLAFATGSQLDSAATDISVRSFRTAGAETSRSVGLFRVGADLKDPAPYIAETDTAGIARFRYVAEGEYQAVVFDDRNRNRAVDANEVFVRASSSIHARSDTVFTSATLVWAQPDTLAPSILGVGLHASNRLRFRFSESVSIRRDASISLQTDYGNIPAQWLYTESEGTIAYALSNQPLLPEQSYVPIISGVFDGGENVLQPYSTPFTGSAAADTTRLRIIRVPESDNILPSDTLWVVFSNAVSGSTVADSLHLVDGETLNRAWPHIEIQHNRVGIFRPDGWLPGQSYQLRLWDPSQLRHTTISFRPLSPNDLGSIEIHPDPSWQAGSIIVEIADADGNLIRRFERAGHEPIVVDQILPGEIIIRAWADLNANGRWDGGRQPEPIKLLGGIPVTSQLTGVIRLSDTE